MLIDEVLGVAFAAGGLREPVQRPVWPFARFDWREIEIKRAELVDLLDRDLETAKDVSRGSEMLRRAAAAGMQPAADLMMKLPQ